METMLNEDDLKQQQRVKCAFGPAEIPNPGKLFPVLRRCAELGRVHVHKVGMGMVFGSLCVARVDP